MEDYNELSDSEKASSIRSKIKNITYQMYNLELDLLVETAVTNPDQGYVDTITKQIDNFLLKKAALEAALDEVSE